MSACLCAILPNTCLCSICNKRIEREPVNGVVELVMVKHPIDDDDDDGMKNVLYYGNRGAKKFLFFQHQVASNGHHHLDHHRHHCPSCAQRIRFFALLSVGQAKRAEGRRMRALRE